MRLTAARELTYAAAARSEREDAELTYYGAAAKCLASDVAMQVTTDAVQLLGANDVDDQTAGLGVDDVDVLGVLKGVI